MFTNRHFNMDYIPIIEYNTIQNSTERTRMNTVLIVIMVIAGIVAGGAIRFFNTTCHRCRNVKKYSLLEWLFEPEDSACEYCGYRWYPTKQVPVKPDQNPKT